MRKLFCSSCNFQQYQVLGAAKVPQISLLAFAHCDTLVRCLNSVSVYDTIVSNSLSFKLQSKCSDFESGAGSETVYQSSLIVGSLTQAYL